MARTGGFIWYELITPDPDAAAEFYGPVVGWTIPPQADPQAGGMDYRMIGRSDGGSAGGVLRLSPEMIEGGARSCWLGYIEVEDVDAAAGETDDAKPRRAECVGDVSHVGGEVGDRLVDVRIGQS